VVTRAEQLSRAGLASAFAVATAAVSHTIAGGQAPSILALALSLVLATLVSIPLVGKSASLSRIAATVLIGQMVLHGLYAMFPASMASSLNVGMPSHNHEMVLSGLPGDLVRAEGAPGTWMIVGHVLAALVTVFVLRNAELSLSILRAIGRLIVAVFAVPTGVVDISVKRAYSPATGASSQSLSFFPSDIRRRGPPLFA
jgi:hypothetical protein